MDVKPLSIRKRLHRMIIWILLLSVVSTAIAWYFLLWIGQSRFIWANHYEQMIPDIRERLEPMGAGVLSSAAQPELDRIIPAEGFKYKVVDAKGTYRYGTFSDRSNEPAGELAGRLNTVASGPEHYFVHHLPVLDEAGQLSGALLLYYKLNVTPAQASDSWLLRTSSLLFLCTPFIFIIFFTVIFVRKLDKEIKEPLDQLMTATRQIREQDLEFKLTRHGTITEIRDLGEAFELMRKELAESLQREWKLQKDRRDMIASLAHDIRTPLTIIQGHVEGLEEAKRRNIDRWEPYLNVIKNNVQRAVKLVRDLNETAAMEQHAFQLQPVRFDPVEFLEEKRDEYRTWCQKEGVRFDYTFRDERNLSAAAMLYADPDRLNQVLDNLLANSLRFAKQGGVRLEAVVAELYLEVAVSDNGPGFEPGKERQVFEAFYQGSGGNNRRSGHSGLGLYIAKSIVVKHGGDIWAYRGDQGGAVVRFRIPLQPRTEAGSR